MQNGKSAEMHKPDPLRFADVWSFVECDKRFGHDFKGRRDKGDIKDFISEFTDNVKGRRPFKRGGRPSYIINPPLL